MTDRSGRPSAPSTRRPSETSDDRYCEWWRIENEPPSCEYSLPIVLKQWGHAVTIVRSPIR